LAAATLGIGLSPLHEHVAVPVLGGSLFVGRRSPLIDVTTVLDVWEADMFPADCAGRVVLDIGAHKGYFGAWALAQGAHAVISCEPHPENFRALSRAHRANVRRVSWDIQRTAVGAARGRARLFSSRESWAHSLYEHMVEATGSEEVDVTDLVSILERANGRRPGGHVVLKLNVEGSAGAILLAVPPERLAQVVEVHLDHEPGSPHSLDDILGHLADAGLTEVAVQERRLFRIRRPVPANSG
jgi:FkbM family methyltransferase